MRPLEPVQLYSCPLGREVAALWRDDEFLTEILKSYVARHGIRKVIDLTAMGAYRKLVEWKSIGRQVSVLHSFWSMGAGDDALIRFGEALRWQFLEMPEDQLLRLDPDKRTGQIVFRSAARPGEGFPEEEQFDEPHKVDSVKEVLGGGVANPANSDESGTWRFSAKRDFQKALLNHRDHLDRVTNAIVEICGNPKTYRRGTIEPLKNNLKGYWKYVLGDFRLIFRHNEDDKVIHCDYYLRRDDRTYQNLKKPGA